jgi:hypothetical protein
MANLLDSLLGQRHNYRVGPDYFPQLDTAVTKKRLKLEDRGQERGRQNLPFADAKVFDNFTALCTSPVKSPWPSTRHPAHQGSNER